MSHSLTGEKCWLPQVPGGWELCHHQGWAYVRGSSESLWVSGERPLFQCSLHEDSNGKRFIWNRSEEKKTWLDVARREFTCWQLEINEPVAPQQAELWEMKLPFEGNTVFMNLRHIFSGWMPSETQRARTARIHNSLKWWRPALTEHGIAQTSLRHGGKNQLRLGGLQDLY